ncbi:MAG: M23 family metallopeptidase [Turicibacter sp.]|nr:M23 family metallopeptidase [Turicibacter sp.]
MAQKLILPINKCLITAGIKNANYKAQFGFIHYGVDMVCSSGDTAIWGCGNGVVHTVGTDNVLGKVVVVKYNDCTLKDGTVKSVVQRIYHLSSINVAAGQSITKDSKLGVYGNTGQYSYEAHLHIEFDTDMNYPTYSPTLGSSPNIIKAGTDTVLNPANVMFVKKSAPDNQSVIGSGSSNCWLASDVAYATY